MVDAAAPARHRGHARRRLQPHGRRRPLAHEARYIDDVSPSTRAWTRVAHQLARRKSRTSLLARHRQLRVLRALRRQPGVLEQHRRRQPDAREPQTLPPPHPRLAPLLRRRAARRRLPLRPRADPWRGGPRLQRSGTTRRTRCCRTSSTTPCCSKYNTRIVAEPWAAGGYGSCKIGAYPAPTERHATAWPPTRATTSGTAASATGGAPSWNDDNWKPRTPRGPRKTAASS
jgi:hypothetical protein